MVRLPHMSSPLRPLCLLPPPWYIPTLGFVSTLGLVDADCAFGLHGLKLYTADLGLSLFYI